MKDTYKAVGSWSTLGLEIVLSVMLGFFGGRWLDGKLDTAPYLSVVGFFFGCGAAVKSLMRIMKEMQQITKREEREHGNPSPQYEATDRDRDREKDAAGSQKDEPAPTTSTEDDERSG